MLFLFAALLIFPCALCGKGKETPTKNDEGPSKANGGMLSKVIKIGTGLLALQSVGLAHGQQTPSELTTFKVPAVNNQPSTPDMIVADYAPVRSEPPTHN
uniref:Uncharacterized protein n=1 Tax=Globodera rostochiensis TaxID=31243 RepID=A0A914H6Y4_GLORO